MDISFMTKKNAEGMSRRTGRRTQSVCIESDVLSSIRTLDAPLREWAIQRGVHELEHIEPGKHNDCMYSTSG